MNKSSSTVRASRVRVQAPARLHMGFLDLNGGLGRRFGSVGLALDPISTVLWAEPHSEVLVEGDAPERAPRVAGQMLAQLGHPGGIRLHFESMIPEHVGLGSGTQLALAVGAAISHLYGLDWDTARVAHQLDRGARSGIGVGAFDHGGFLLDGGRGEADRPPPLLSRLDFPETWSTVLILDRTERGLHGAAELQAFRDLPQFPADTAAHLCRVALMQLLPAIREQDLALFARAIWSLQTAVGDHFAPAQQGRFSSPAVASLLEQAAAEGLPAGQSSWGPTGFVVQPDRAGAERYCERLGGQVPELEFLICRGRNTGAEVLVEHAQRLASS
ncbi:GHMP kinase [Methylonatrum kenyense]|uniref:beta-ribofuranosylaminobenzene 5'-phosphate synthase family protein n=1 Tax=Methylonatrum kenyense TaxID=455253 RepID=UPI0020BF5677|nr:beta-ribofuranosylaminobenzene 5'-phosphate synthase family protein [Methylonatrum kenyense]MCK8515426.1 GHMP kinase [Methylonatrum kenyense]